MIKFYYNTSPNPMKIALCLEEMNLPYEAIPIDTRKGDQHSDSFKAINPNAKAPAIKDDGNIIFDSNICTHTVKLFNMMHSIFKYCFCDF